jgi:antirestriction protein
MEIKRDEMLKMIENANSIDELAELREMMECGEYEIECVLEMSCRLTEKEMANNEIEEAQEELEEYYDELLDDQLLGELPEEELPDYMKYSYANDWEL